MECNKLLPIPYTQTNLLSGLQGTQVCLQKKTYLYFYILSEICIDALYFKWDISIVFHSKIGIMKVLICAVICWELYFLPICDRALHVGAIYCIVSCFQLFHHQFVYHYGWSMETEHLQYIFSRVQHVWIPERTSYPTRLQEWGKELFCLPCCLI